MYKTIVYMKDCNGYQSNITDREINSNNITGGNCLFTMRKQGLIKFRIKKKNQYM